MKKIIFLFVLLASMTASATVTVTPLGVDYATQKVTFKVEWTNSPIAPYNNRVWIWIDFCPITGTTPGSFAPATITGTTITSGSGSISGLTGRGFFIAGSATNSGTTITATLNPVPAGKFNWCVYGSDYPPNVTFDEGTYTFKGTTDFIVSNPAQTLTTKTIAKANLTVTSSSTFTDPTGYPGIGSLYCPYTGSDLYMDATHLCQQRASGAKNWEAYIKDSRDSRLYRIVLMPDQKWYMAQNLNYRGVTYYCYDNNSSNCNETNGVWYYNNPPVTSSLCPSGWILPSCQNWNNLISGFGMTNADVKSTTCSGVDTYGLTAMCLGIYNGNNNSWSYQGEFERWIVPETHQSALHIYNYGSYAISCECSHIGCVTRTDYDTVRCSRQL